MVLAPWTDLNPASGNDGGVTLNSHAIEIWGLEPRDAMGSSDPMREPVLLLQEPQIGVGLFMS